MAESRVQREPEVTKRERDVSVTAESALRPVHATPHASAASAARNRNRSWTRDVSKLGDMALQGHARSGREAVGNDSPAAALLPST
ncbi:MAG TPA: hypothetical protein VFT96_09175 [Gemmatimonadaceae bacterium]|nr:hypothetical protein [Gemmatimonadaceae bacterium]